MGQTQHLVRPYPYRPTSRARVQDAHDLAALTSLSTERKYALRRADADADAVWLEWVDGQTEPPEDPDLVRALHGFAPFEPFRYPSLSVRLGGSPAPVIPHPTFLLAYQPLADTFRLRSMLGVAAPHVRDLAGRLELDGDRRAVSDKLSWLVAYRDALALEVTRCGTQLTFSPSGVTRGGSTMDGARDVLRVWMAEASQYLPVQAVEMVVSALWDEFRSGASLDESGIEVKPPSMSVLEVEWLDPALVAATAIGLRHYARIRDVVTAPAYEVWPRLLAAETVLHAALVGTPLDEAWIEETLRREQDEEARSAREAEDAARQEDEKVELRRTLLDPQTRLAYIVGTLHPQASRDRKTRSIWRETWKLFVALWESLGLEGKRPYPTFEDLKDAVSEDRRRERKRGARGRQMG